MVRGRSTKKSKSLPKPKRTKPPILDNTPIREINSLMVNEAFIYQIDIYKLVRNSYNLEDSRFIKGSAALDDSSTYKKHQLVTLRTVRTMVAAPLLWLKDEGYTKC